MDKYSIALSIVIPIYNEEENIDRLYKEIISAVDPLNIMYEIIFIDDGSTDDSFENLKRIKKAGDRETETSARIRIIRFSQNYGQTLAMQSGFEHARGEVIVSMDGDLQNDPADIPALIEVLQKGYDVVCGWRKNRKDKTISRIIPSKVANWMIGKVTGVPIHDNGCSLKAFRSSVVKSINLYSDMHRFIPAITTMVGARITEIVVNHRHRRYGESKYGINRIWKVLFDIFAIKMLIHFYDRPMVWFSMFGMVFLLLGVCLGVVSIILFLQGSQSIVFPASCILSLFLFVSLMFWGILSEYFIKIEKYPDYLISYFR